MVRTDRPVDDRRGVTARDEDLPPRRAGSRDEERLKGHTDDSLKRKLTASRATVALKAARDVAARAKEPHGDAAELKEKLTGTPVRANALALKASTAAPRRRESALRPVLAPYADGQRALTPPETRATLPECEVRWWRGYVKSQLVAVTDVTGTDKAVAASPYFRAKGRDRAESPVAAAALHALVWSLQQEGWRVVGRGDEWFSVKLRRQRDDGIRRLDISSEGVTE